MERETAYKVLIVGDVGVGKSCIVQQLLNKTYSAKYNRTVGVNIFSKIIKFKGQKIKLCIYDSSGEKAYRLTWPIYYKDAIGIILVYNITKPKSFEEIMKWYCTVAPYAHSLAVYMLIGNQTDLKMKRKISTERGKKLAKAHGFLFMETSAKLWENVELIFHVLVDGIQSQNLSTTHILHKKRFPRKTQSESNIIPRHKTESEPKIEPCLERKKMCCRGKCFYFWPFW